MFPYRDDNPTLATPVVTFILIAANVAVWTHLVRRRESAQVETPESLGFAARLASRYNQRLAGETMMVNDLFEDSEGFIWLATRNGLSSLDPSRKIFKRYFMDSADESTIPNNRIYSLLRDTDSTFFLICDQSGLASFNTKTK